MFVFQTTQVSQPIQTQTSTDGAMQKYKAVQTAWSNAFNAWNMEYNTSNKIQLPTWNDVIALCTVAIEDKGLVGNDRAVVYYYRADARVHIDEDGKAINDYKEARKYFTNYSKRVECDGNIKGLQTYILSQQLQIIPLNVLELNEDVKILKESKKFGDNRPGLVDGENLMQYANNVLINVLDYAAGKGWLVKGDGWKNRSNLETLKNDPEKMALVKEMFLLAYGRGFENMKTTLNSVNATDVKGALAAFWNPETTTSQVAEGMKISDASKRWWAAEFAAIAPKPEVVKSQDVNAKVTNIEPVSNDKIDVIQASPEQKKQTIENKLKNEDDVKTKMDAVLDREYMFQGETNTKTDKPQQEKQEEARPEQNTQTIDVAHKLEKWEEIDAFAGKNKKAYDVINNDGKRSRDSEEVVSVLKGIADNRYDEILGDDGKISQRNLIKVVKEEYGKKAKFTVEELPKNVSAIETYSELPTVEAKIGKLKEFIYSDNKTYIALLNAGNITRTDTIQLEVLYELADETPKNIYNKDGTAMSEEKVVKLIEKIYKRKDKELAADNKSTTSGSDVAESSKTKTDRQQLRKEKSDERTNNMEIRQQTRNDDATKRAENIKTKEEKEAQRLNKEKEKGEYTNLEDFKNDPTVQKLRNNNRVIAGLTETDSGWEQMKEAFKTSNEKWSVARFKIEAESTQDNSNSGTANSENQKEDQKKTNYLTLYLQDREAPSWMTNELKQDKDIQAGLEARSKTPNWAARDCLDYAMFNIDMLAAPETAKKGFSYKDKLLEYIADYKPL